MSDKRTKFVLGTVITSLALVLAATSVLPNGFDTIVSTQESLGMTGHFIIIAEDPDRVQYIQSDNKILADGLDLAGLALFSTQPGGPFDEIHLSGDAVAGTITAIPSALFANTGAIQGTYTQTATMESADDCGTALLTTCEQITGDATQVDVADASEIKSVALADTAGNFLAWSDLSPTLQVTPGTTTVTITYKVQLG